MRVILLFKTLLRIFKYLVSVYKRYLNILIIIIFYRPKSIMEIGVYNGKRATEIIEAAKIFNKKIKYYGFDLFENFYNQKNLIVKEHSKFPNTQKKILKLLSNLGSIELFKGFTSKTLPNFLKKKKFPDLIFIDGGHAIPTIKNDWHYVKKVMKKKTVVIFDDYYEDNSSIIKKFGCNRIINNLDKNIYKITMLPFSDQGKEYAKKDKKKIRMVKVVKY